MLNFRILHKVLILDDYIATTNIGFRIIKH